MDPGKNNHIGIRLFGLLRQAQAVAYIIGHVLDIRILVIMRQHNGVLFLFNFSISSNKSRLGSISTSRKPISSIFFQLSPCL